MKTTRSNRPIRQLVVAAGLSLAAAFALGAPQSASANGTADATLVNMVSVSYRDATLTNQYFASDSTSVTVNLVRAALANSGPPTAANGIPGISCLAAGTYTSGTTVKSLYALTARANGDDTYKFSIAHTANNANADVVEYSIRDYTGTAGTAFTSGNSTRILGSAIPVGTSGDDTLLFPGGSLAGFAADDVVIVEYAAGSKAYLVASVTPGTAGSAATSGTTAGTLTDDTQDQMVLKAYANQTITLNTANDTTFGGGNAAPAFTTTAPTLGVPVGEMVLVEVDVTATANTFGTAGDVDYTLTVTDNADANPETITCNVGDYKGVNLTITKEVRLLPAGAFAATATGNPGETLEYKVTIANTGGLAKRVVVTDAVPDYTTLIVGSAYGTNGGGNIFAEISDDGDTTNVAVTTDDNLEVQPHGATETGYGDAAGSAAGSAINFYVGDTATSAQGGEVDDATTYTILYQVKID